MLPHLLITVRKNQIRALMHPTKTYQCYQNHLLWMSIYSFHNDHCESIIIVNIYQRKYNPYQRFMILFVMIMKLSFLCCDPIMESPNFVRFHGITHHSACLLSIFQAHQLLTCSWKIKKVWIIPSLRMLRQFFKEFLILQRRRQWVNHRHHMAKQGDNRKLKVL